MKKVLIANRGEIAVRIARACADEGLTSVAVYSEPDAEAFHVHMADEAYALPGSSSAETYLDIPAVLAVAERSGADAVHPGYGFLSENAEFARAVVAAGLTWIGPAADVIEALGNKVTAREIAVRAGAPLVPGTNGPVADAAEARAFAEEHGLPVALKAAFGGGGRGMRIARELDEVEGAFDAAVREATAAFGRGECFVERFLERPRHVEAQVVADSHGTVTVVGTRDCSLQRRHQKLVEEAPAPFLTDEQRTTLHESARAICREAGYTGAGTVEYLVAPDGLISFLEVNTRLQVEHPVTEQTSGVDLVREQFRVAQGLPLSIPEDPAPRGHAFEFRLNAEDPALGFLPTPGTVEAFEAPTGAGVRVDTGVRSGSVVPAEYDSLLAKLIVWGEDRQQALVRSRAALRELVVRGLPTVVPFHRAVLEEDAFVSGTGLGVHTTWIEDEFTRDLEASPYLAPGAGQRSTFTLEIDGRAVRVGLPEDLAAALLRGGGTAATGEGRVGAASSSPDTEGGDDAALTAPMNGTVVTWLVADGAQVDAGQPVLVVEAMKMETPVRAHRAGTLTRADVAEGDSVTAGQTLGEIS
ncbi:MULTISPECIES: biotin carboxylase N-terminal domain-containing protein [unclassified Kocuria]|uniref:acetyl/propionyl/methylcrotonyl-CoA carboxylase subunit alpha n=1 Tax=unclassified Kocuria TaxID=2649579 RepID=UPI000F87D9FE|nr:MULTISPECIES: biotin carboxylase N-terminal domain-containing protein [unclassified Kocuria]RUP84170.1 ATP-grasp domain-containing protein [Kocuria sp. HSID17590]RUQ10259.1 ATP-grasp domain-containing protein [Kocuria sp. HSID17582]